MNIICLMSFFLIDIWFNNIQKFNIKKTINNFDNKYTIKSSIFLYLVIVFLFIERGC